MENGRTDSKLAKFLGEVFFLRGKGQFYVEVVRGWIAPAAVGGGFVKYLGADNWWSIAVAFSLPFVVEGGGYLLGRFLYMRGGVTTDYALALAKDPYRSESLELFRRISQDLAALRAGTAPPEHSGSDLSPRSRPSAPR